MSVHIVALQKSSRSAVLLDEILDVTIEAHIELFKTRNQTSDDQIAKMFEPMLLSNIDSALVQIHDREFSAEIISKAIFRYGYIPVENRGE